MADREWIDPLPDLAAELRGLLRQVPRGRVTTYGDLADGLGDRRASRWVGAELLHHRHGPRCRCHRVVRAGGDLGSYITGRVADKRAALQREGVACEGDRVDLGSFGFAGFRGAQPLCELRRWQHRLLAACRRSDSTVGGSVAGIDVSYHGGDGVAAYVELANDSREVVYHCLRRRHISFPYIPTYLSFRELPLLLDCLDQVRREHRVADIVMVDGSGILHPHRAGVATMLGHVAAVPTIGVTKKHLYGRVDIRALQFGEARDVCDPETAEVIGQALLPRSTTGKPIFVSPGYLTSVRTATQVVRAWLGGSPSTGPHLLGRPPQPTFGGAVFGHNSSPPGPFPAGEVTRVSALSRSRE